VGAGTDTMASVCADLAAECAELDGLLNGLDAGPGWRHKTRFHGWTVWDQIAHLHFFDELALLAVADRERFAQERDYIEAALARGTEISAIAQTRLADLPGAALAPPWRAGWHSLIAGLAALDARARLPWFGPEMGARSFATARLMETWAHGQDIWDALGRVRPATSRLAHIAQLGVITFRWSFQVHGLAPPAAPPAIELRGPDGEIWRWGDPSTGETIRGSALDFCLVVTQRRHHLDTNLEVQGEIARAWMSVAQCFAGPPASAPPAGSFPR
jgi:uncharacterized protein (TIGR03084 family)